METARVVCKEMLMQRGWVIDQDDGDGDIIGHTGSGEQFIVFFTSGQKLNISNVKDCIKVLDQLDIKYSILVYCETITSSAKRVLTNLPTIKFELFALDDLQYNITKHIYARPHIRLEEAERVEFVKTMGQDIPVLQKTDPMCRFYNFDKGDIIKVIRKNDFVSYRIVK